MSNAIDTTPAGAERRRTPRMSIPFRIEVCGRESKGSLFRDETTTMDVNEHGCKFDLAHQVDRGDLVTIRRVTQNPSPTDETGPMLFQIVWTELHETGCIVGAMKLQDQSAWPMTFPAKSSSQLPVASPS